MSKYKDIFLSKDIFYAGFKKLSVKVRHFNTYYTQQSGLSQALYSAIIIQEVILKQGGIMGGEQAADYGNIFNEIINNILDPIVDIIAIQEE